MVNWSYLLAASAIRLSSGERRPRTISSAARLACTQPLAQAGSALTGFHRRLRLAATKTRAKEMAMKWKAPVIIEIAVGLEINAYACAEVK